MSYTESDMEFCHSMAWQASFKLPDTLGTFHVLCPPLINVYDSVSPVSNMAGGHTTFAKLLQAMQGWARAPFMGNTSKEIPQVW
jgi:hypothetical protein